MNTVQAAGVSSAELMFGIVLPQPAVVIPRTARNLDRGARRDRLLARRPAGERGAHRRLERVQVVEILARDLRAPRAPSSARPWPGVTCATGSRSSASDSAASVAR